MLRVGWFIADIRWGWESFPSWRHCIPLDRVSAEKRASCPAQVSPSQCPDREVCFSISSWKIHVPRINSPRGILSTQSLPGTGQNGSHHGSPIGEDRVLERSPTCSVPQFMLESEFEPVSIWCYPLNSQKALRLKGRICEPLLHAVPKGKVPIIWQSGFTGHPKGPKFLVLMRLDFLQAKWDPSPLGGVKPCGPPGGGEGLAARPW